MEYISNKINYICMSHGNSSWYKVSLLSVCEGERETEREMCSKHTIDQERWPKHSTI